MIFADKLLSTLIGIITGMITCLALNIESRREVKEK